jgi:hypothetical protein
MDKEYTAPSIEFLGTLKELTAKSGPNQNGCFGVGTDKTSGSTDGFNNAQTGCS